MRSLLTVAGLLLALSAFNAGAEELTCTTNESGVESCSYEDLNTLSAEVAAKWVSLGCIAYPQACAKRAQTKGYSQSRWVLGCGSGKPFPTFACFAR